jgi:DNA-binding NarL/FixJ family response regulator
MRILVADMEPRVRFALRVLLEHQPGIQVVGEAATPSDLLDGAAVVCPDLILMDWNLAGPGAAGLVLALRGQCPHVVLIALSSRPENHRAALAAGVDAFVSKGEPPEQLLESIARCCAHEERGSADSLPSTGWATA